MTQHPDFTLVCGGGGVWGVAWMTGLANGLASAGVDLRDAATFIGTSAGSVVSTQLARGLDLERLFARQTNPAQQPREPVPDASNMSRLMELIRGRWHDERQRRTAMCKAALEASTIGVAERRVNIKERLGLQDEAWPSRPLYITAIDAETMELTVFDGGSGVSVIDAVAASCAVPGVWPPASINGRRYIDGGVSGTSDNALLAAGARRVLILSPAGNSDGSAFGGASRLAEEVARLEESGATVVAITPDEQSLNARVFGVLDPASRKPAAVAGKAQARAEVAALAHLWARSGEDDPR